MTVRVGKFHFKPLNWQRVDMMFLTEGWNQTTMIRTGLLLMLSFLWLPSWTSIYDHINDCSSYEHSIDCLSMITTRRQLTHHYDYQPHSRPPLQFRPGLPIIPLQRTSPSRSWLRTLLNYDDHNTIIFIIILCVSFCSDIWFCNILAYYLDN